MIFLEHGKSGEIIWAVLCDKEIYDDEFEVKISGDCVFSPALSSCI